MIGRPRPLQRPRTLAAFACIVLGISVPVAIVDTPLLTGRRTVGHADLLWNTFATARAAAARPNIVFVLTDDFSTNLLRYMPQLGWLRANGMSFLNFTVTDSLCCPSRASTFTGQYPHDTGVRSNDPPTGGYLRFRNRGDEWRSFARTLTAVGYRTAFLGKYLNGYRPSQAPANPPGWNFWAGSDGGAFGYNYSMSINGRFQRFGTAPQDYATNVLSRLSTGFVRQTSRSRPFMLEVATNAPHEPCVPAPRDIGRFPRARAPRLPNYNRLPTNAPTWLRSHRPLTTAQQRAGDRLFRLRVEAIQAVDRMIAALRRTLSLIHALRNTVFVFSSDNGFHIGEHRLGPGKLTPYTTDVNVPLIIAGPGIRKRSVDGHAVQNIDLAPTFDQLAGARIPRWVDGHSLVPLLHSTHPRWRTLDLVEHAGWYVTPRDDPDWQPRAAGRLGSFTELRSGRFTYVQYANGEHEYYSRRTDPYQLHNIFDALPRDMRSRLRREAYDLSRCHGYSDCWADGQPTP